MSVILNEAEELTKKALRENHPNSTVSSDPEADLRVGIMGSTILIHGKLASGDIYRIRKEILEHLNKTMSYDHVGEDQHEITLE